MIPGRLQSSLILEIPCDQGDAVWERDDAALLERCLDDLDALGVRVRGSVTGCFSTRIRHGYPVFRVGYEAPRATLLERVAAVANLWNCGRQATFRYVFMDTAMEMGRLAARQVLERDPARKAGIAWIHDEAQLLETKAVTARR